MPTSMKRSHLMAYQAATGLCDTFTGLLLVAAPATALRLMKLHAAADTLPFLSYIGVFVLSVGIACFYRVVLLTRSRPREQLEVVWFVTTVTRGMVAAFLAYEVVTGQLEQGWIAVIGTDGAIALLQFVGLTRGWLRNVSA
jgi:hypothetical protein